MPTTINGTSGVTFPDTTTQVTAAVNATATTVSDTNNTSTGYFKIPVGTTAQRPGSPSSGMIRQNTTTGLPEWYDATSSTWVAFNAVAPYVIEMFAWGGGGGGGGGSGVGGGGGAATGSMLVTSGTAFAVVVGGGGQARGPEAGPGPAVAGGGGNTGNAGYGGQGGGYSGIFTTSASQANAVLIAGGGGGGSYDWSNSVGGAGGGTNGQNAQGTNAANGASQSAGGTGTGGVNNGAALQGGTANGGDEGGGGGGGGGYWGGGAGNGSAGGAGGGGSGYFKPTTVTSAVLTQGNGTTPGDSSNALRGSYGQGATSTGASGTQGVFIIRYLGSQRGTGGTVTSSGGYTIHTFTTAGTYTS